MMPTFPASPLSFRTAGFPQYGWKEVPVSQMQPSPTVPWLKCDHIHHGPSRFTALFALLL